MLSHQENKLVDTISEKITFVAYFHQILGVKAHLLIDLYLNQPSKIQKLFCFDFAKLNSALPYSVITECVTDLDQ